MSCRGTSPARIGPLCSVATLAGMLSGPAESPVLIDCRWTLGAGSSHAAYLAGHIPSALWADLDADFADPPAADRRGGRHPLPSPQRLQAVLRSWGIRTGQAVVVYDAADSIAAARAWWVLRWAGLESVAVLNGGLAAWTRAGGELASGEADRAGPGDAVVRPGGLPVLDPSGAAELAGSGLLLDARTGVRFAGEAEPIDPVAGHIPGARSLPAAELMNPDGTVGDPAQLHRTLEHLEPTDGARFGAYCGSGVTAAHTVWALATAGVQAELYPGSWSDWITDPDRPVATGR